MAAERPSQALTKRSAESALMPPPPPPKRIKRPAKVIDEDKYTASLSKIIARDFFPGLAETESQQEYLDALESQDTEWIAQAGRKLTQIMTPGPEGRRHRGRRGTSLASIFGQGDETPQNWRGETPVTEAVVEANEDSRIESPEVDLNLSLSAFQAKYTSEDNESFNRLLDKQNNKRREKYAWFWNGNQILSARQIAHRSREAKLLEETKPDSASTDLILAEKAKDKRPAMPEHKPMEPRNSFMFSPDSIEETQSTIAQATQAASNAPPKSIIHGNTRLPVADPAASTVAPIPPSPSMSAIDAAIAGRPRATESEAGYTGSETPRVAGYAFVDAEPAPSEIAHTRGESGLNPQDLLAFLTPADQSQNHFKISDVSKREDLHHKLVEKSSKSKKTNVSRLYKPNMGGETPGRTPTPKYMTNVKRNPGNFTPAGQSLLKRIGTPLRQGSAWDEAAKKTDMSKWKPMATPKIRRS